jgi:hypothetical protein
MPGATVLLWRDGGRGSGGCTEEKRGEKRRVKGLSIPPLLLLESTNKRLELKGYLEALFLAK